MAPLVPDYSQLNYEEMAKNIGLNVKHMPMLVGGFLEESLMILESLQVAIDKKDFFEIQSHAHSLKGSAANLRFKLLAEYAKEMEYAATREKSEFPYEEYFLVLKESITSINI